MVDGDLPVGEIDGFRRLQIHGGDTDRCLGLAEKMKVDFLLEDATNRPGIGNGKGIGGREKAAQQLYGPKGLQPSRQGRTPQPLQVL